MSIWKETSVFFGFCFEKKAKKESLLKFSLQTYI